MPRISNVLIFHYPLNLSDHLPVELDLNENLELFVPNVRLVPKSINWKKVVGDKRREYESIMESELNNISVPDIVHGNQLCDSCEHVHFIETYYQKIVDAIAVSDAILPRCSPTIQRDYWNDELKQLKKNSVDAFALWNNAGRPTNGAIFELKKSADNSVTKHKKGMIHYILIYLTKMVISFGSHGNLLMVLTLTPPYA